VSAENRDYDKLVAELVRRSEPVGVEQPDIAELMERAASAIDRLRDKTRTPPAPGDDPVELLLKHMDAWQNYHGESSDHESTARRQGIIWSMGEIKAILQLGQRDLFWPPGKLPKP
jgi:hypothetical protein